MKFSIVLSTQPAAFTALAYKGKIEENIRKIKQLGYDGVELAVRDPKKLNLTDLQKILRDNSLPVSAIGTGQAFGEEGLFFTHSDETIRLMAIERIKHHMDLAEKLNALVIIGLIRGQSIPREGKETAEQWMLEALKECASVNPSVRLVVEPINRYESQLLCTVEDSLRFLDKLAMDNVGLLLDTFHMNIEEPDIYHSISLAGQRLFHFHMADSNRWYPGAGHIDFEQITRQLQRTGFKGFLSAEILPMPDPDTAAEKAITTMIKIRDAINGSL